MCSYAEILIYFFQILSAAFQDSDVFRDAGWSKNVMTKLSSKPQTPKTPRSLSSKDCQFSMSAGKARRHIPRSMVVWFRA